MRRPVLILIFSLFTGLVYGQEEDSMNDFSTGSSTPSPNYFQEKEAPRVFLSYRFGQFSIPEIQGYSFVREEKKMDILVAGKEMGLGEPEDFNFPASQNLTQYQNNAYQRNFRVRTNAYGNSGNRRTLDGGIWNDVYEGAEEPFIDPYFHRNNSFYRSQNFQRLGSSNFYFSR